MAVPAVTAVDVSPEVRTSSVREWLTGARPVVGATAAASLMLLACSWFALESGTLGRTDHVRERAPIQLHAPPRAATRDVGAHRATHTRPGPHKTSGLTQHTAATGAPELAPTAPTQPDAAAPVPTAAPATTPAPTPRTPTPASTSTPTPVSAPAPPASDPVTPVTEVVDELVPPVTVTVPAVTVPSVTVSTPIASVSTPALTVTPPSISIP